MKHDPSAHLSPQPKERLDRFGSILQGLRSWQADRPTDRPTDGRVHRI